MCYSAIVEQNIKKLELRFGAKPELAKYAQLFDRRLKGEKLYLNKAMEYPFTHQARSPLEQEIAEKIRLWHDRQLPVLEQDLFKQKKRLADAQRSLAEKTTKKAQNEQRIATNKIEKIKADIERHGATEIISESEERIFPHHYMSMLCLDEQGERVIRPTRYLMRPHNKDESFDTKFGGCYNARYDSLESVPWWKDSFGKRHGLLLVRKFYENVDPKDYAKSRPLPEGAKVKKTLVLCFEPDNVEYMFIPTLWDCWQPEGSVPLYSAALITDEPAPEIAEVGHDRTPIFLREDAVEDWLKASSASPSDLHDILNRREHPHYSHRVMGAA